MTLFCVWVLPYILSLKRFPRLIFFSHFVQEQESAFFPRDLATISLLLSGSESIVSALLCDVLDGGGCWKHACFAGWHQQVLTVEGTRETLQETGFWWWPVSSPLAPPMGQLPLMSVQNTLVLAHSPATFAGTLAGSFLLNSHSWQFPACRPLSSGTPVGSFLFCQLQPPSYGPAPTQDNRTIFSAILCPAPTPSLMWFES